MIQKHKIVKTRKSKHRDAILEALMGTKSHPTASWIYQEVRKSIPKISLGTVYRNLRLLSGKGDILELHYGDGQSRFDGTSENHYHFTCQVCGTVFDVEEPLKKDMEKDLSDKLGFIINHHRVEFYGICKDCQEKRPK